jgi:hypothetical protein
MISPSAKKIADPLSSWRFSILLPVLHTSDSVGNEHFRAAHRSAEQAETACDLRPAAASAARGLYQQTETLTVGQRPHLVMVGEGLHVFDL